MAGWPNITRLPSTPSSSGVFLPWSGTGMVDAHHARVSGISVDAETFLHPGCSRWKSWRSACSKIDVKVDRGQGCRNLPESVPGPGGSGIDVGLGPQSQAVEGQRRRPSRSGTDRSRATSISGSSHPRLVVVPGDEAKAVLHRDVAPASGTSPDRRQAISGEVAHCCWAQV